MLKADYGSHTLLQRLKALEGDLELVGVAEFGWVVEDIYAQEGDDRHLRGDGIVSWM